MWAVLGDIEFELLNHPSALDERTAVDFAEHALIQGKPRLEYVGEALDELTLELLFHVSVSDPETQIRALKQMKLAHEPVPLVFGSGEYRGVYLVTSVETRTTRTDEYGRLLVAGVTVALREYTGPYTKPLPKPKGLADLLQSLPGVKSGGLIEKVVTGAQKVVSTATKANNLLRAGINTYESVKALAHNPQAMLGRVGELVRVGGDILEPLKGLQEAADMIDQGFEIVSAARTAASDVEAAIDGIKGANLETIFQRVGSSTQRLIDASSSLGKAAPKLAGLAANIITRRV